ncbi:MAG: hypothetical protein RR301_11815 [Clostridia bacterium]
MSIDTDIAQAVLAYLNAWGEKPCEISFELAVRKGISMKMQPLSATVIKKKYITGSFVGDWPFAVYVRINKGDTASRASAMRTLDDLGRWISTQPLPNIGVNRTANKVEITGLPSIAVNNDDGSEEYQALYCMEYKQSK